MKKNESTDVFSEEERKQFAKTLSSSLFYNYSKKEPLDIRDAFSIISDLSRLAAGRPVIAGTGRFQMHRVFAAREARKI